MKEIKINMSDIGYGANVLGITHGFVMLTRNKPAIAAKVNYLKHNMLEEDMTSSNKKFYNSVYDASMQVYKKNLTDLKNGKFVVTLGGDHSLALGSVKASMEYANEDIGLIWIDAHADINTFETTESGNIHGMPVSSLLGINEKKYNDLGNDLRIKPENLVYFATRDVDVKEAVIIEENNIREYSDKIISESSFEECIKEAIEYLKPRVSKIHISLDLDGLTPDVIKGVSTPVKGGLNVNDPIYLIKEMMNHFEVISFDIVEYNPLTDTDENTVAYLETLVNDLYSL